MPSFLKEYFCGKNGPVFSEFQVKEFWKVDIMKLNRYKEVIDWLKMGNN